MRIAFVVFESEHWTMPDLIDTLQLLTDDEEASTFLSAYEAVCGTETAEHNLRYMFGLIERTDQHEALRLSELFMLAVPGKAEVLSPRHTFGMSSFGVIENKPLPSYDKPGPRGHEIMVGVDIAEMPIRSVATRKAMKKKPMKRAMLDSAPKGLTD